MAATPVPEIFVELPAELQREIFEVCALRYRAFIPTLMLVAHYVKEWVEPLLFHTIYFGDIIYERFTFYAPRPLPLEVFRRALQSKSIAFFAKSIRRLFLGPGIPEADLHAICAACSGPLDVRLVPEDYNEHTLPILRTLKIERLTAWLQTLFNDNIDFNDPVFSHVTHLSVSEEGYNDDEVDVLRGVSQLPTLTHLYLDDSIYLPVCGAILDSCPRLRVLAIFCDPPESQTAAIAKKDARFVVFTVDCVYAWSQGGTQWIFVDNFMAKRAAGEIDSSSYVIDRSY
ncbi:hypothetical protein C8R43DRAFT_269710 [Mycena crocata]|nr:hypothetical protein C8R43DRAFT_269710 [Mycena crocata]